MKKYYLIGKVKYINAPLYIHWLAIVVAILIFIASIKTPLLAAIAVVSYLAIVFIHEFGHALAAKKLECSVVSIKVGFFHGWCEYEKPYYEWEDVLISWAGVLAQFVVGFPIMVIAIVLPVDDFGYFGPVVAFLGYINLVSIVVNIVPGVGLDGEKAWRIVPLLVERYKTKRVVKKYFDKSRGG